jgi:glucose 1-dehydrogenase
VKLRGKVVLVTGASTGIGRALALGFAGEGADVIVNYRTDRDGAEVTASEIRRIGRRAIVAEANIARVAAVRSLFRRIVEEFGRLDVLVNNAAVTGWGELFEMTEERWDEVIGTNLKGTFFCSIEAARLMRDNGKGGTIVNISTNCAELGVKNLAAYAASKGGVHALTKQLAVELAPHGIRVNTFAPGPTLVDRNLRDDPDYNRTWGEVVPLNRAAAPEEMVGPAVFLASSDSSYMTGQIFFVDGGWTVSGRLPADYFETAAEKNH